MVVAPLVVALLLAAALMHATWNALLKADRSDRLATFGVIMTTGTVMGLVAVPFLPMIEFAAWKFLATSVIVHVAYYTFLLKAYSYGDLSHTYPIARGHWWRGAIGGVIANTGYGIAIYALVLGPMAHVAALRETSVLFGALMGTVLLGEPFGARRVVAAAVIVAGLLLMNGPQLL